MLKAKLWGLKNKLVLRFDPGERAFRKVYPEIDKIEGFLRSPQQEKWFFKAARRLPDTAVIVEIGSFKGRSTASFGFGCVGTHRHIYAIDLFEGDKKFYGEGSFQDIFDHNMRSCRLTSYVTAIKKHSLEAAKAWTLPIDILFIDGSHEYEDVKADFNAFYPLVKSGGVVALHDITGMWTGVTQFWGEIGRDKLLIQTGTVSSLGFGVKP